MTNIGYLTLSIMALTITGIISILYMHVHTAGGVTMQQIGIIFGFLTPTIAALIGMLKSFQNGSDIKELHIAVNSRLTQLLEQTALSAQMTERAAGKGRDQPKNINEITSKD